MPRLRRSGAFVVLAATPLLSSCMRSVPDRRPNANPPVYIDFKCGTVNSIGLTDALGRQAWSVNATRGNPISWIFKPGVTNVTINAIAPKPGGPVLPIKAGSSAGGSNGKPYDATVDANATPGPYTYSIDVTCTISGTSTVHLVIDPEMIIL